MTIQAKITVIFIAWSQQSTLHADRTEIVKLQVSCSLNNSARNWHTISHLNLMTQSRIRKVGQTIEAGQRFKEIGFDTLSFRSNPALVESTALHSLPFNTFPHSYQKKKLYVGSQREQGCPLVPNLCSATIDSQGGLHVVLAFCHHTEEVALVALSDT